ncbi:probable ATP-dependent RNA helicase kurz [Schistocerca serialis cubense]|uniref:probable ATP-dependent RNA helicase kurz n=1 Tax=Schistocerca serialis cubense TaxID=2023355 RepID=UPI00214EDE23|nr:probable ATP-dependent RNA helicase kurz [Schistocerca serialis cubense]
MGKNKKGFNWKAREVVKTHIDNTPTSKINVDIKGIREDNYDQCNALVIPSQKRKTRKKREHVTITRILSKKQRKRLEKIVEQKKKKENRANLLEALSKVQASPEVLNQLTSITKIQTEGLKRHLSESGSSTKKNTERLNVENGTVLNSISGSAKRRRLLASAEEEKSKTCSNNPNVVGLEGSDGSDDSDSEAESVSSSGNETEHEEAASNSSSGVAVKSKVDNISVEMDNMTKTENLRDCVLKSSENSPTKSVTNRVPPVDAPHKCENVPTVNSQSDSGTVVKSAEPTRKKPCQPAVFVPVHRTAEMQESRLKLPILAEEQAIMEAINENPVVVLAGETGSGKTTQVPQFLYEAGYANNGKIIGVTEPRRVAAISMSVRVAEEMNLTSKEVSYLIRFEGNTTKDTKIKFMTDGVLLKEIQSDFLLTKYSVIILDEAHERSVYTDILIGLLSRIVPLRNKRGNSLKLIIMSATLRLEDFTENSRLFKVPPPVIKVDSRQFPVTVHFNKRTWPDYVREAYKKACKIHTQLPEGGILVFVTGQKEVKTLVQKLRKTFPYHKNKKSALVNGTKEEKKTRISKADEEDEELELDMKRAISSVRKNRSSKSQTVPLPEIDLSSYSAVPVDDTEGDLLAEDEGDIEDEDDLETEWEKEGEFRQVLGGQPLWVLPLYSLLSTREQSKVFETPPEGCRLCVVATNVAETSLTIPNIKYVVDSGRTKTRLYDKVTGVSAFAVVWASKAAANQRAGRAGRMGPGHCYRLYSSAVFNDQFENFSVPEIQRKPVDDLVLQMKAMGIDKVVNFPFPSAPDGLQLRAAERRLKLLGILETVDAKTDKEDSEWSSKVTELGRAVAVLPLAPRFGKMLALGHQHDLLPYAVCMVAALSVQELLLTDEHSAGSKILQTRRAWAGSGNSLMLGDPMVLLRAVGAAEYAASHSGRDLESFCSEHGLRHKAMLEVRRLRVQLASQLQLAVPELELAVDPSMPPPSDTQARHLRQLLLSGLVDQVAHRVDLDEIKDAADRPRWKHAYRCLEMEDPVFIHAHSVLKRQRPEWVVYQEVYETNGKLYMRGITAIEPEWLPVYAPALCNFSEPQTDPPPHFCQETGVVKCHITGTFGRAGWQLPVVELEYPTGRQRYQWFARFLLEGEVFPKLKRFTNSLLSAPATMNKTWANLQPRTEILLRVLASEGADSRRKLLDVWKDNPKYLLEAYQKWLPESAYNEAALLWPPV